MKMIELEKHFNDNNWIKYSIQFENSKNVELTTILDNDIRLANVVFGIFGIESLTWMNKKIPALDNLTPKECLASNTLKNRLKECLMRIPQ